MPSPPGGLLWRWSKALPGRAKRLLSGVPVLDGGRFAVDRLEEDALHAADIDEVVSERALAGGVEPFPVALTEGDELGRRAASTRWKGPAKSFSEKASTLGPSPRPCGRDAWSGAREGIGCLLGGVVAGIGCAASPLLA
ncbi:MAG: hypothetical protein R3B97_11785 [Dehalococcoidia bacterium]